MRATTKATIEHYLEQLDVSGDVLEIGGHTLAKSAIAMFPAPRYRYRDLNIAASDIPDTVIADITDCRAEIPDESFDLVFSSDVFEHIDRPWLAAAEISRILRPGGIAITATLFGWRNHPCPIDYWRFSADCLEFLFADLECLEKGYDLSQRRHDQPGFWPSGEDSVPIDSLGGWREHWAVYSVNRKGPGPAVPRFKDSSHKLARHLRQDTQGTVTNPKLLGLPTPDLTNAGARLEAIEKGIAALTRQLQHEQQERARDRRAIAANAPVSIRAYRSARRRVRARLAAR